MLGHESPKTSHNEPVEKVKINCNITTVMLQIGHWRKQWPDINTIHTSRE
jgi:hypothetical protein